MIISNDEMIQHINLFFYCTVTSHNIFWFRTLSVSSSLKNICQNVYDRSQEFVNVSAGDCCSLDGIWWIVHRVHCEFFIFVLVFLGPTKWPKLWKQKWFTFQSLWSCISCENFRIISYKKSCKQWLFVILYFLWKQINTNLQKVTLNGNACFYIDSKFNCLNSNFSW